MGTKTSPSFKYQYVNGSSMHRRSVLELLGASVGLMSVATAGAAGDADPRPEPYAGELPDENVPYTIVVPLPCSHPAPSINHVVPAGDWIRHTAGWGVSSDVDEPCEFLREFLNNRTDVFIIDGERFVLSEADDWDITTNPESARPGVVCVARFNYTTPPKRAGTTYDFTWKTIHTSEIRVVNRKNAESDCA